MYAACAGSLHALEVLLKLVHFIWIKYKKDFKAFKHVYLFVNPRFCRGGGAVIEVLGGGAVMGGGGQLWGGGETFFPSTATGSGCWQTKNNIILKTSP